MKLWLSVSVLLLACGELPDPKTPAGVPEGEDLGGDPSGNNHPSDDDDDTNPAAPILDPIPSQYGYDSLPVRGSATPYLTVFAEGGRAPVATDVSADGSFCIDVPLKVNQEQTVNVFAQDSSGKTSEPAEISIAQDPELADPVTPEQPVINLAPDQDVYSDEVPKEGTLANVTDDNPTSSVLIMSSTLWIDFGAVHEIERVELVFPAAAGNGDDTFATEYQVLIADGASPAMPPADGDAGWSLAFDVYPGSGVSGGDGGTDTLVLPTPAQARYVAVYLIENNMIDWFSSEDLKLAELRVFGRADDVHAPAPTSPTCANGGNAE